MSIDIEDFTKGQEKMSKLVAELKAPKGQRNSFGGYNYRSAEDILEAVKPLLDGALLTLRDDIVLIGDRFYVKATARYQCGAFTQETTAFAREPLAKKGMDESQITGAASSYARKYALNGLLCIDDTKDSDATNTSGGDSELAMARKCLVELINKLPDDVDRSAFNLNATDVNELRNMYKNIKMKYFGGK